MNQITNRRDRRLLSRPAARFRLAFTIWFSLAMLAFVLYERRHDGAFVTTSYLFVAILLAGFAGMLSYFAWLMYVPTITGRGEDDIPIAKFFAGLATLIPPCVIGASMLPVGSRMTPWFVGFFLIVGCFALLTPHQEYLFARHTRRDGLLGPRLNWNLLPTRDSQMTALDFSRLEYAPTTLGSTYARTMTQLYDPDSRDRRYEPKPIEPVFRERQPVTPMPQSERVVPPTRIAPRIEPRPESSRTRPTPKPVEPPRVERRVEPEPRRQPEASTVAKAATVAATTAVVSDAVQSKKRKNKKQRRKERQAAREAQQRAEREAEELAAASRVVEETVIPESEPAVEELKPGLRDFVDNDGVRCIEGIVEAVFQPGQKRAYAHVAFTPTFDRKPEVICEIADDSDARLKSPQAFSYGTRLELSRKQNAKQREVVHIAILARG